jgi:cob(I)alamin adenosyltransferase
MPSSSGDSGPRKSGSRPARNRSTRRSAEVTTRTGDDGYTSLLGRERVPKWHPRPDTYGTLDEATSALGLARAMTPHEAVRASILELQRGIYYLMAELATGPDEYERSPFKVGDDQVNALDVQIEDLKGRVVIGQQFIIPGETSGGAALDLARAIVRRAERLAAHLLHDGEIGNQHVLRYLNRLSDLLFVLARYEESLTTQS